MVVELPRHAFRLALPLFDELAHHLSIAAVLAGAMPGRVLADDVESPGVALVLSPEGNYLASAGPPAGATLAAGRAMVERMRAEHGAVELFAAPDWERQAGDLLAGRPYELVRRRRYLLSALGGERHRTVPAELALVALDATTMAMPALEGHHIRRWAHGNWGSVEAFLERGFGSALFHDGQPVSWSLADSVVGGRCEIGIRTHPDYRRRGLATIVAAANVARALERGCGEVGWHCGEENLGSQGVAEKVGFRLTHRFHGLVSPT